jgi:diaminohydroxyphosphoribosylaminopyrimidine deaminase/5-amino-6-(5-phosphoribosylamino)uracil reductase
MQRALFLAEMGAGRASPGPMVGCVLVQDDDVIVGEGYYVGPPGSPHAEVIALQWAGEMAHGATAYVTLEPCSHTGTTPPCTAALIEAGIRRVVFAAIDPDARVSGQGKAQLEAAGIKVEVGDGESDSERLNEAYIKHRRTGLPFVAMKYAATLDGRIAAASGDSRWVSGPDTLRWTHAMRPELDAILVGASTVVVDNPQLTARPDGVESEKQPLRVVLDSTGRISAEANVLKGRSKTLVATTPRSPDGWRASIALTGAEVLVLPQDDDGHVALRPLLEELGRRGVLHLLVEGGGVVNGSFFDQRLVDKLYAIIAPMIVGAADAPGAVAGHGAQRMADAVRLRDITVNRLGDDVLVTGYPIWPETEGSR